MSFTESRGVHEQEHYRAEGAKLRTLIKAKYRVDFRRISEKRFRDGLANSVAEWDGHNWLDEASGIIFDIDSAGAVDCFSDILRNQGMSADEYYAALTVPPNE